MTVDEIFNKTTQHMLEGLMFHSRMIDYFSFLGLEGYAVCHKYHYFEENNNYRKLTWYYMYHYGKIIKETPPPASEIIPSSWYSHNRKDVSEQTRLASIQTGFEKWASWEKESKKLYEEMYKELTAAGEIAAACEIKKYIEDVNCELAEAEQKQLELTAVSYDIHDVMMEQKEYCKCYRKKLKEIVLC